MSKYVKNLITQEIARRLHGVENALLVNVIGLDANKTMLLRRHLRQRGIQLMVVKNSLARRATEGTPLAPAFQNVEGPLAVVWGGDDFVALAKEIVQLEKSKEYEPFQTRGGVLDGERLTPEKVEEISRWPTRQEQLAILAGQILSVGAGLSSQLLQPGRLLASQIEKLGKGESEAAQAS